MAISFVTNALGGTTTTTSFSITLPTTQAGDLIIVEFTHRGTGDGTPGGTSGLTWNKFHEQLYNSNTFSGQTYWARATGNHAGQTVTWSGLTNSCAAIATVYRGVLASGTPLASVVGEANASGNETQAEITTTEDESWVVLVVANSPDVSVSSQSCTSPGALTERAERLSTGGTDTAISHASAEKATAGATGSFTWSQTNGASGSWAYEILAEPPPPPFTPELRAYRWYNDDGDEDESTPAAAENTAISVDLTGGGNSVCQLRIQIDETGGATAGLATDDWQLQYRINSGAWTDINGTSTNPVYTDSVNVVHNASTTDRATNGISDPAGTFDAGLQKNNNGLVSNFQLGAGDYTEHLFGITFRGDQLVDGDVVEFRVTLNGGTPGMTQSSVPTANINVTPPPDFTGFRFYNDDGDEEGSTPKAAENTNITLNPSSGNVPFHLRCQVRNPDDAETGSVPWRLQRRVNGGSWVQVDGGATHVTTRESTFLVDSDPTTNRATNGISDPAGSFQAGLQEESGAITFNLNANSFTEFVWSCQLVAAEVADGDVIEFRVTFNNQAPGMTQSVTPQITVDVPAIIEPLNQALESDTAQAFGKTKLKALNQSSTTETANAITASKTRSLAQATETETANALTGTKVKALAQSSESDTAQALTRSKLKSIDQTIETDSANELTLISSQALGQAIETSTAQAFTSAKVKALATATESSSAGTITAVKVISLGTASESDVANSLTKSKALGLAQVSESSTSGAITPSKTKAIGQAIELDSAESISAAGKLDQAVELDTAQAITPLKTVTLNQAIQTETAQAFAVRKTREVLQAAEAAVALAITPIKAIAINQASELEEAFAFAKFKQRVLDQASTTETANDISFNSSFDDLSEDRTYTIDAEDRTLSIDAEDRTLSIAAEDRSLIVDAEDRSLTVDTEDRTLTVPSEDRTIEEIS